MPGFKLGLLSFLCALLPILPGSWAGASDPIQVAVILSITGIAAPHNEPLLPMIQLAAEEINRQGGVLGRPIQLVVLDNESTPLGSKTAAQEAVRLKVAAVVGAHWSSHSMAMAPTLQAAGIPMISPGSTNPEVTRVGDYIFRICFLDSFQGRAVARFAREDLKAARAAVVRNIDETYSVTLADYFSEGFTRLGGTVVIEEEYRGKAIDFEEIILRISKADPEVIFLPGYTRDSGLFIRQARRLGVRATFLGGDAWDEVEKYAGGAVDGSYQSAPWHPAVPFAESRSLQHLYQRKFHEPVRSLTAPQAFDAMMLLAAAIQRAGTTEGRALRAAIAATRDFPGATGRISYQGSGDPVDKEVIVIKFAGTERLYHRIIRP